MGGEESGEVRAGVATGRFVLSHRPKTAHWLHTRRANGLITAFLEELLRTGDRIIHIGAGTCHICSALQDRGFDVTPVDIRNRSYFTQISPIIYDKTRIPYPDNHFDVAMILTVLHHVRDQEGILREAMRVSKRLIVIEDVYANLFGKYLTFFLDSIGNLEFRGHPHSNRMESEWRSFFEGLGLRVNWTKNRKNFLWFQHCMFLLEKQDPA
jgi:SAM-dependent methyltransferase